MQIVLCLTVVRLLDHRGVYQAAVRVENRLREACGARGEVDRAVVVVGDVDARSLRGAVGNQPVVAVGKAGTFGAHIEEVLDARQPVVDLLDSADELGTEYEKVGIGFFNAVFDLLSGVAEVERNRDRACLEDAEIDRQPLEAVHQQDGDLVALADASCEQQVGEAVRLDVKLTPGELLAERAAACRLDQIIFAPCDARYVLDLGIDFHQRDFVLEIVRVSGEKLGDWHSETPSIFMI